MKVKILKCKNNVDSLSALTDEIGRVGDSLDYKNVVLVKENFSLTVEREILSRLGLFGSFSIDVLSFTRLMLKLSDEQISREYISHFGAVTAIAGIIMDRRAEFLCYSSKCNSIGYAEKIYELIIELKGCGIAPRDLATQHSAISSYLSAKLHDIALIYSDYEGKIATKYFDESNKLDILCDLIDHSDEVKSMNIFLTNFDGYTLRDYKVIAHLLHRANSVVMSTVCGDGIYLNDSYENIIEMLGDFGISYEVSEFEQQQILETATISQRLFSYMGGVKVKTQAVSVYTAAGVSDEIENLAAVILRHIRNGGRYKDFSVVCQDHDAYRLAIRKIFTKNNIPYYLSGGAKLIDHPAVRFLLDAIKIKLAVARPQMRDYFSMCKNPFMHIEYIDACKFENYVLKYGINYEKLTRRFTIDDDDLEAAESVRFNMETTLMLLDYSEIATGKQYCDNLRTFFSVTDFGYALEMYADEIKDVNRQGSEFTAQVLDKIISIIDQIELIYGDRFLQGEDFLQLIKNGFSSIAVSLIPVGNDCVFIGSINDVKFSKADNLAVIGASDDLMPVVKRDWGLINAKELEMLIASGMKIKTLEYKNNREKLNCYLMLQNFSNSLYVSYSKTSAVGKNLIQSKIITYLCDMFELSSGEISKSDRINYSIDFVRNRLLYGLNSRDKIDVATLYEVLKRLNAVKTLEKYLSYYVSQEKNTRIDCAMQLFLGDKQVSGTAIECFYKCPFMYFAERGLGLREREIFGLSAIDIGNYLHRVAELYSMECATIQLNERDSDMLVDNIISKLNLHKNFSYLLDDGAQQVVLTRLSRQAKRICYQILRQYRLGKFALAYHEYAFGGDNGINIFGDIKLKGKIDRVDTYKDFARIVDYKSGDSKASIADIYVGKKLQLPLYSKQVEHMGYTLVGQFYFPLKSDFNADESDYKLSGQMIADDEIIMSMDGSGDDKSTIIPVERLKSSKLSKRSERSVIEKGKFQTLNEYGLMLSKNAVEKISKGYIEPKPLGDSCEYCNYKNLCSFDASSGMCRSLPTAEIDSIVKAMTSEAEKKE